MKSLSLTMSRDHFPSERLTFETAAEHVCTRVPVALPSSSVTEIRSFLEGKRYDCATHIAICDDGKLAGILRIEDLLSAAGETTAAVLMDANPPVVMPGVDQEIAAWRAVQHNESALSVVDGEGKFIGFIPPHRLLAVLLFEHEEDMTRLGGFIKDTSRARTASQEPLRLRFWHRVPWLLVGLAGALVAADIVESFEGQLREKVILAFFIPGIVYLADAVGTQTETLVVRGLSVGVSIKQMALREALTGLLVGIALSLVLFPLVLWRWGGSDIALAVSLSLLTACSMATIVAMSLPWALQRVGRDPAFGSGPLATVVQDILSIVIYFVISTRIID
jgi:magnesium transporter